MKLSKHFTLAEATYSATAISKDIKNVPGDTELVAMTYTAAKMELVRELLGNRPILVNSWFRNPEVNRAVGGSPTSQHARGEAVDFRCPRFGSPRAICLELMKHREILGYDQLILEPSWVHISFTTRQSRGSELTLIGRGQYQKGIS